MPMNWFNLINIFSLSKINLLQNFHYYLKLNLLFKYGQYVTLCYSDQSRSDAMVQNDFRGISPMI